MKVNEKKLGKYSQMYYLIFRIVVGLMFAIHGAQKFGIVGDGNISAVAGIFGVPVWLMAIGALIELLGGIAILIGFHTRIAAFFGALQMIAAYFIAHIPKGILPMSNGGELAVLYFVSMLLLMGNGGGKLSLTKN